MTTPKIFEPKVRQLIDVPLHVGESPVWDPKTGELWFVDILAPAVFRLKLDGTLDRFHMSAPVGCLGLCESDAIIVGLQTGVHILDPASGKLERICDPDNGRADSRLNDGKVGPDGHFWVGTRDEALPPTGNARLYRVSPDGQVECVIDGGMFTSNGLAWSPDGRKMYHSDSSGLMYQTFDFDPATGVLGKAQRMHGFGQGEGRPDGATIDREGFYWSAGVSAGRLNRFSPDGDLVEVYRLPFDGPTMPCFGGADFKTLYVTSLRAHRGDASVQGTVVAFETPVAGIAPYRFKA